MIKKKKISGKEKGCDLFLETLRVLRLNQPKAQRKSAEICGFFDAQTWS